MYITSFSFFPFSCILGSSFSCRLTGFFLVADNGSFRHGLAWLVSVFSVMTERVQQIQAFGLELTALECTWHIFRAPTVEYLLPNQTRYRIDWYEVNRFLQLS